MTTNTIAKTIPVQAGFLAVNPTGNLLYAMTGKGVVSVIDTTTNVIIAKVSVGSEPGGYIAVNSGGTFAYVTN